MAAANLTVNLENANIQFQQASAQTRLVVLYYLAKQLHQASKAATPSALFSQKVQAVIKHVQQLPKEERHEALQEILAGAPTRLTEAYEALDTNMRMAFWYRVANSRRGDVLLSKSLYQEPSSGQRALLADLASRDSNELVSFLHEAVADKAVAYRCR
ncbi:MAG: hypothetical protein F6J95_028650 [Leptolyngbya sp. SIO1E4]|nr:hypothetical protein [Leptolyngbya sp. SIO1E4]